MSPILARMDADVGSDEIGIRQIVDKRLFLELEAPGRVRRRTF